MSLEDVRQVRTIFSGATVPGSWKTPKHLVTGIGECVCNKTLAVSRNAGEVVYRCIEQVTAGAGNGAGHMTIRSSLVDDQVREAVLTRYLVHPDRTATADVEAGKLADLHAERSEGRTGSHG